MSKKTIYEHIDMFDHYEGVVDADLQVCVCASHRIVGVHRRSGGRTVTTTPEIDGQADHRLLLF